MELFKSRAKAAVEDSKNNADAIFDATRVTESKRAIDYYLDILKQEEDLYEVYSSLFDDTTEWSDRPKSCYNLTAGFVETLSTLYQDPVKRKWEDDADGRKAAELWEGVEGFDDIMQNVDEYTLLSGTVGVRPIWIPSAENPRQGKIEFAIYPSHSMAYIQVPTNPREAQELMVEWDATYQGEGGVKRHYWSSAEFYVTFEDTIITEEGNKFVNRNPYKTIPITIFRNRTPLWGFFDKPATDLVKANLTLNSMCTDLNYTTKFQTHDQLVLKGADDDYVPRVGPSRYIKLPKGDDYDAFFLGSSADIDKAIAALDKNLDLFFASRRIPKNAVIGITVGSAPSGVAIIADQASLASYRNRRINSMRPSEAELIQLTLKVKHFHETGILKDFPAPTSEYKKMQVPMSDEERANWDWKITNNVATPVDFIMAQNPDLSEEEAEEQYLSTVKKNQELGLQSFEPDTDDD